MGIAERQKCNNVNLVILPVLGDSIDHVVFRRYQKMDPELPYLMKSNISNVD